MGRPTNRYAARREESLAQMSAEVDLPPRAAGESQGAYYRRCAVIWLSAPGDRDAEMRADVLRLGALAASPKRP
jgi:hypothetical protein